MPPNALIVRKSLSSPALSDSAEIIQTNNTAKNMCSIGPRTRGAYSSNTSRKLVNKSFDQARSRNNPNLSSVKQFQSIRKTFILDTVNI